MCEEPRAQYLMRASLPSFAWAFFLSGLSWISDGLPVRKLLVLCRPSLPDELAAKAESIRSKRLRITTVGVLEPHVVQPLEVLDGQRILARRGEEVRIPIATERVGMLREGRIESAHLGQDQVRHLAHGVEQGLVETPYRQQRQGNLVDAERDERRWPVARFIPEQHPLHRLEHLLEYRC